MDKLIAKGEGLTEEEKAQYVAETTDGYEAFEVARQHELAQEAVRIKTKADK